MAAEENRKETAREENRFSYLRRDSRRHARPAVADRYADSFRHGNGRLFSAVFRGRSAVRGLHRRDRRKASPETVVDSAGQCARVPRGNVDLLRTRRNGVSDVCRSLSRTRNVRHARQCLGTPLTIRTNFIYPFRLKVFEKGSGGKLFSEVHEVKLNFPRELRLIRRSL